MASDITCVLTGHREGRLCVASLRSFWAAIDRAEARGIAIQPLLVLDRPDDLTLSLSQQFSRRKEDILVVEFGDQGLARNAAVDSAQGTYTAFLDADDLWSEDWLWQAHDYLNERPTNRIAHPAYNYFFEGQASIFRHIDQESPEFRLDLMRFTNYWDALCLCRTQTYRDIPFCKRDLAAGWAYEDWHWNCETIAAGMIHKVVPDTILFKRRQSMSQTILASRNQSMIRQTRLLHYDDPLYRAAPAGRT